MVFENGVKNIQAEAYNGASTIFVSSTLKDADLGVFKGFSIIQALFSISIDFDSKMTVTFHRVVGTKWGREEADDFPVAINDTLMRRIQPKLYAANDDFRFWHQIGSVGIVFSFDTLWFFHCFCGVADCLFQIVRCYLLLIIEFLYQICLKNNKYILLGRCIIIKYQLQKDKILK